MWSQKIGKQCECSHDAGDDIYVTRETQAVSRLRLRLSGESKLVVDMRSMKCLKRTV